MSAREKAASFEAAGELHWASYWNRIADIVDASPPLTDAQLEKLTVLFSRRTPPKRKGGA